MRLNQTYENDNVMGRIGITYQGVAKAISTLQGQQKNPTVDNIREIMGTGSKSTIARFLREWKSKNGLQNDDDGALPSDLINLVKGLWGALQEKADNQSSESMKECDEKIAQMQQQLSGYRQSQSETVAKIHILEEQNHRKTNEIDTLKQALNTEQHEKIKIIERAANLESNKEQAHAEIERLHQLLKHVQGNLEHYQMATQQLRQEQALQIEKQRSEYEQKISQLQNQMGLIFAKKTNYQAQFVQLNKIHDQLEIDHKALVLQYNELQQQQAVLKISHEKMQKDYEQLVTMHQQQSQNLEGKHHTVIELQLKLKAGDEKITVLENELSKANDKINALRHDHQFTAQEKANLEGQLKQFQSVLLKRNAVAAGD